MSGKSGALLARVVTANNPIPRLKEHPALEAWINEGRPLHEGKDTCQFCGQPLGKDLMTHIAGHFSADYENLMSDLSALIKAIQTAQHEEIAVDHKGDFYTELSERFSDEKTKLGKLLKARKSGLENLATVLATKQTKAFTSLECPNVDDPAEQIVAVVEAINKIITEHNNRTAEFDQKRRTAFTTLEKHYAAKFILDEKYNERLQLIEGLKTTIGSQTKKLGELNAEIRALEQALSEALKGATRINELLTAYSRHERMQSGCASVSENRSRMGCGLLQGFGGGGNLK
ncbi:MAG TPA: AAA family ATPase [Candidatus Angelobacter sp.]|nr:AAA family ATPase [Candidatus Angelobacter sp.]